MKDTNFDPITEKMGSKTRFAGVRRNLMGRGFVIELIETSMGKGFVPAEPLRFDVEVAPGVELGDAPGLGIGEAAAQQILEDLWAFGLRPKSWKGDDGSALAAQSANLEDLRLEITWLRELARK